MNETKIDPGASVGVIEKSPVKVGPETVAEKVSSGKQEPRLANPKSGQNPNKYTPQRQVEKKRELRAALERRFSADLRLENKIIKLGAIYAERIGKSISLDIGLDAALRCIEISAKALQARRNKVVADRRELEAKVENTQIQRNTLNKDEMRVQAQELIDELNVLASDNKAESQSG